MNWLFEIIKNLFSPTEPANPYDGLLPSPADYRDVNVKDLLGAIESRPLPEEYMIPFKLPIKDQGTTPECVGWSCSTLKDEKERREQNETIFDGAWLYKECKKVDGIPEVRGTYFRTGLDRLAKIGIKPMPNSPIQGDPANFRIGGYARVDCEWEALKRAIITYGAILGGFYIYPASWNTAYIKKGTNIVGGHATALIGWNKDYIIGQNSFGEDSGDKGLFYVPRDYLPYEAWAILSDRPTELLPTPVNKPKYVFEHNLFEGIDSQEVKVLQEALKWLGCFPNEQTITTYYGPVTKAAVRVFQTRYGILNTGNFGPLSRDKMNDLLK